MSNQNRKPDAPTDKQPTQDLKFSSEDLSLLVEEFAALATFDGEGFIVSVNNHFCTLSGYTASELVGTHHTKLQHPLRTKNIWKEIPEVLKKGEIWRGEICSINKCGTEYWTTALIRPIASRASNTSPHYSGIFIDITKRKDAEDKLVRTTQLLQQTSRVAQVGGWEVDLEDNSITWSSVTRAIHEVEPDYEPQLATALDFYAEEEGKANVKRQLALSVRNGKPFEFEHEIRTAKGNRIWVRSRGIPVQEQGKTVRLYGTFQNIEQERRDQATLRENYAWLESTISAATRTSIIGTDTTGTITVFNRGAEMLLGYTAEELIGKKSPAIFHDLGEVQQREKHLSERFGRPIRGFEVFTTIPDAEGSEEREWTYISKDGSHHPVSLIVTPITDQGQLIGYLSIATDRSDVKAAEQRSLENELRFRGAFENAGIGSAIVALDGTWLEMNERLCSILGYAESDLLKLTFQELTHPEDLAADLDLVKETLSGRRNHYQMKKRYFRQDGTIIWVNLNVSLVRSPNGEPLYFVKHVDDISERVLLEKKLVAATERLSLAMQVGGIGIWDWDIQQNSMQWDDQMFALHGIAPNDSIDLLSTWENSLLPEDRERTRESLNRALAGQEDFNLTFRIRTRSGEIRTLRAVARTRCDNLGKPLRMIGTNWDVSELNSQREQLAKLAEEAKRANDAKTEFLANMSHEIRTPMNGIIGMTRMLLDSEGLSEQQVKYAEIVKSSAASLLSLINDILDFSKIESGMLTLEELDFCLRETLDDFASLMRYRANEKGLSLTCEVSSNVHNSLIGDSGRLRQILLNLTGNAIKFTSSGSIKIHVDLEKETEDHIYIRFSVKDTGIGIPNDKLGGLFDKFTQADTSTSRIYGGTGLGLAISRQLSELMGGQIGVESVEGKGSTFWFTIRFTRQTQSKRLNSIGGHMLGSYILIVDENQSTLDSITQNLSTWSCTTNCFQNGEDALRELDKAYTAGDCYDCVIASLNLPSINGVPLPQAIRQDTRFKDMRIVLTTDMGEQSKLEATSHASFNAIVTKPIHQSELFNAVSRSIDPSRYNSLERIEDQKRKFRTQRFRILLAEDNAVNQMVACGILDKLGLRVDVVANGNEALNAVENLPYDAILMDVQMPELDGLRATQILKSKWKNSNMPEIPIIAMTAHARPEDRVDCLEAGMCDYISKPVSPEALSSVLHRWLPDIRIEHEDPVPDHQPPKTDTLPAIPEDSILDFSELLNRVMGDEELALGVIEMSLRDLQPNYDRLKEAVQNGDETNALLYVHSIKGSARNASMMSLAEQAEKLEQRFKDHSTEDNSQLLQRLGTLTQMTIQQINTRFPDLHENN